MCVSSLVLAFTSRAGLKRFASQLRSQSIKSLFFLYGRNQISTLNNFLFEASLSFMKNEFYEKKKKKKNLSR